MRGSSYLIAMLFIILLVSFTITNSAYAGSTISKRIQTGKVCGLELCNTPMTAQEKIKQYLISKGLLQDTSVSQQSRFSIGGVTQQEAGQGQNEIEKFVDIDGDTDTDSIVVKANGKVTVSLNNGGTPPAFTDVSFNFKDDFNLPGIGTAVSVDIVDGKIIITTTNGSTLAFTKDDSTGKFVLDTGSSTIKQDQAMPEPQTLGDNTLVTTNQDGTITVTLSSGQSLNYPAGTTVSFEPTSYPSGITVSDTNDLKVASEPGGKTTIITSSGTQIISNTDGTYTITFSNGQSITYPAGTTISYDGNTITVTKSDGTIIKYDADSGAVLETNPPASASTTLPSLSIADVSVTEGTGGTSTHISFTVTSSVVAPTGGIPFTWSTADGTATSAIAPSSGDYYGIANPTPGMIRAGQTTATLPLSAIHDSIDERDETFTVTISSTSATISDGFAIVTIIDDDTATAPAITQPALSIADVSVTEGNSGLSKAPLTITVTPASSSQITVNLATADGTATATKDYTSQARTITIPAGQASVAIGLEIIGDTMPELDEAFTVTMSSTAATIADGSATVIIKNDEIPKITLDPTSGPPGTPVTIIGSDFFPLTKVTFTINKMELPTKAITTDSLGKFKTQIKIPDDVRKGDAKITAMTGKLGGSATFTVKTPPGSKIVFSSNRDHNTGEIYTMNADGTGVPTRLTTNTRLDYTPSFSPDETKIAFTSNRDNNEELYIMNADGTGVTRLTTNTVADRSPSFSPDGTKIVFASIRDNNLQIYIMNADGTGVQTRLRTNTAQDQSPSFSPDGTKIAFTSGLDNTSNEIYIMNVDGSDVTRLTTNTVFDGNPSFSPDGTKIAFTSNRDHNTGEIYIMNADGTGVPTRLTTNTVSDHTPSFSPTGTKIAFQSQRDGNDEIYIMNADGTGVTRLTTNTVADYSPNW